MATSGMVVVLGYQLYDLARGTYHMTIPAAALQLGLLGFAQFLPVVLLTPIAGVVADRFDRRIVAGSAALLDCLVALSLAVTAQLSLTTLPLLYLLAVLHGIARVFIAPAQSAIVPNIVPPELLPRAIAINSIAMQIGGVAGPALGGLLFALSPAAPYWTSAMLLAFASASIFGIRPVPPPPDNRDRHPLKQMTDGLRFVVSHRFLLGCVTLDLFAVLLGGATALLPVYARDILAVGPHGLGLMRAAPACGAAIVALVLARWPLASNVGIKMLWAVAAYGAATLAFGLSRSYPLSLGLLAFLGAADMVSVFIRSSLVQLHTPDSMRGRVSAISSLAISASNELGEMESGVAAALFGATGAVVFGGVGAIVITFLWGWLFPEIRRARTFAPHFQDKESAS
jgi:MFS family permease